MEKCLFKKLKDKGRLVSSKLEQTIRDSRNNSEVTSKYFKPKTECMMESELDESKEFVQKKPSKKVIKKVVPKKKSKKKVNSVKSHDLRKYTRDFDKVCKANSVDVDSEELQLAIALSKSISDFSNRQCESDATQSHSNDSGLVRIKKTLVEFGFKLKCTPESNIESSKKLKRKRRADYQLIKRTDQEKQQMINDKISQILIENLSNQTYSSSNKKVDVISEILKDRLCLSNCYFNKTCLSYQNSIDEIHNYYVKKLIVPSSSKVGCLLKDWRTIPGREKSPERYIEPINIQEHILYKHNFDLLLSGKCSEIQKEIRAKIATNELRMDDYKNKRSQSPDIFGDTFESNADKTENISNSDDQMEIKKNQSHNNKSYSFNNETLSEEHSNGIIHYESYNDSFVEVDSGKSTPTDDIKNTISSKEYSQSLQDECVLGSPYSDHNSFNEEVDEDVRQSLIKNISNEDDDSGSCSGTSNIMKHVPEEKLCRTMENINTSKNDNESQIFSVSDDEVEYSVKPNFRKSDEELENRKVLASNETFGENLIPYKTYRSITGSNESIDLIDQNNTFKLLSKKKSGKNNEDFSDSEDTSSTNSSQKNNISLEKVDSSQIVVITDDELDCSPKRTDDTPSKSRNLNDDQKSFKSHSSNEDVLNDKQLIYSNKSRSSSNISMDTSKESNNENISKYSQNINESERLSISYSGKNLKDPECSLNYAFNNSEQESTESSQIFVISDDELDYSVKKLYQNCNSRSKFSSDEVDDQKGSELILSDVSQSHFTKDEQNFKPTVHSKMYRSSILDTIYSFDSTNTDKKLNKSNNCINSQSIRLDCDKAIDNVQLNEERTVSSKSPCHDLYRTMMNDMYNAETPENSKYVLKTENVTPLMDYNSLGSPDIVEELSKYGLRPIKRKRAVQILEHIYEQTHPTVNIEDLKRERKKRKLEHQTNTIVTEPIQNDWSNDSMDNNKTVTLQLNELQNEDVNTANMYGKDCEIKYIENIDDNSEDVILPLRKKIKVYGCSVPLHIAFYNYLAVRSKLREAVLRYEPIDIEAVHRGLKENGFNYNPKDLMRFMDKKCITIKINAKEQGKRSARTKR